VNAIEVDNVWKRYPRWRPGTRSVRSMLSPGLRAARRSRDVRWALREVSFSVERGAALGVIGHNGAGKSTLLRLISGLGQPTRGTVRVTENSASVLSLGDTFSAELTGRENATTASVIAGLRLSEARAALPAILEFAELDGFEDAPLRSYSDGMKLRLAFGVVAQLRPELLVLDEVLAVGDLSFHQKCMTHLQELRAHGASVLLASHDLGEIVEQCDRVLWLDHGRVRGLGDPQELVDAYQQAMYSATLDVTPEPEQSDEDTEAGGLVLRLTRFGSQRMQIEDVVIGSDGASNEVDPGGTLDVGLTVRNMGALEAVVVSVEVNRPDGDVPCIDLNTELDELEVGPVGPAGTRVTLSLDDLELGPGEYFVNVGVYPTDWAHAYDYHWHYYPLTVRGERKPDAVYRPQRRRWTIGRS
jgi:lipopolysaccharide transport system ATP-binding protein